MESRPRIQLTLSPLDKRLELTGKLFLGVLWGLTLYTILKLPATIPIHFNTSGKVDGYGDKLEILILPVVATLIYLGISELNKYPHIFNYMTEITEENARVQYTAVTKMFRFLKLTILIIFSFIILFTYLTTIGVANGLGFWFFPGAFALVLIPTIISLVQSAGKKE